MRTDKMISQLAFNITLGILLVILNFGFGCTIEIKKVWLIVKKPYAPILAFVCQFLLMPLVAFSLFHIVKLSDVMGLGLLVVGSCPGGGGSNLFTLLLDADLELSMTMTFISTLGSLAMTPMWIWSLGRYFMEDNPKINIPIKNVLTSLAAVILPVLFGVFIKYKFNNFAEKIKRYMKLLTVSMAALFFILLVLFYYETLKKMTWKLVLVCALLSLIGYIIGYISSIFFLKDTKKAITIALEVGIQNFSVAAMMISTSLTDQDSQKAGIIPILYNFVSGTYPIIAVLIVFIHNFRATRQNNSISTKEISSQAQVDEILIENPEV